MEKDFDAWNGLKKSIHNGEINAAPPYFSEREVWWCSLGLNIGDEEDGKTDEFERPVLILRIFNKRIAWVIPLTSRFKEGKCYYPFTYDNRGYSVLLSQIRLVSTKRLRRKIYVFPQEHFVRVREKMKSLI